MNKVDYKKLFDKKYDIQILSNGDVFIREKNTDTKHNEWEEITDYYKVGDAKYVLMNMLNDEGYEPIKYLEAEVIINSYKTNANRYKLDEDVNLATYKDKNIVIGDSGKIVINDKYNGFTLNELNYLPVLDKNKYGFEYIYKKYWEDIDKKYESLKKLKKEDYETYERYILLGFLLWLVDEDLNRLKLLLVVIASSILRKNNGFFALFFSPGANTGKTTLIELISKINKGIVSDNANSFLGDSQFSNQVLSIKSTSLILNEIRRNINDGAVNKIKSLCDSTSSSIQIEKKQQKTISIPNVLSIIGSTNKQINFEYDDAFITRLLILNFGSKKDYFIKDIKVLHNNNVIEFLMNISLNEYENIDWDSGNLRAQQLNELYEVEDTNEYINNTYNDKSNTFLEWLYKKSIKLNYCDATLPGSIEIKNNDLFHIMKQFKEYTDSIFEYNTPLELKQALEIEINIKDNQYFKKYFITPSNFGKKIILTKKKQEVEVKHDDKKDEFAADDNETPWFDDALESINKKEKEREEAAKEALKMLEGD